MSDCGVMPPPEVSWATPTANTSPLASATSMSVLRLAGFGVASRRQLVPSKWTTRLETAARGRHSSRSQPTAQIWPVAFTAMASNTVRCRPVLAWVYLVVQVPFFHWATVADEPE